MKMNLLAETIIQVCSPNYSDELTEKIADCLDEIDFVAIVKQKLSELDIDIEQLEVKAV